MHKTIFLAIATLIIIAGCTYKTPYTNRSQMIFMSQKEEMALGEKSYKESLSQSKIITGTKDATRIKNIGARIAKVANRNDFQWEFNLVEDEAINAFCSINSMVIPCLDISFINSNICETILGANPKEGSSSSNSLGVLINERAIASICCSPPESSLGL